MLKWLSSQVFWGLMLILAGVLFLLQNLNVFQGGELFWGIAMAVVGVLFLGVFFGNRSQWWALIPGVILTALALLLVLTVLVPGFNDNLAGVIVLGGIGLAFFLVYLASRAQWWAIIPGGVLVTLAVVAGLEDKVAGLDTGGIFFIGLGLTFALVAILPNPVGKMRWAWIPAAALLLIGILTMAASEKILNYIWPVAVLLGGIYLVWMALRPKSSE
ncbi:MAG TPA: hypothetical protein PKM21_06370 [Anaerolineales bacterium]|nr:hypothetical protein [Anaerolineales bacterium]